MLIPWVMCYICSCHPLSLLLHTVQSAEETVSFYGLKSTQNTLSPSTINIEIIMKLDVCQRPGLVLQDSRTDGPEVYAIDQNCIQFATLCVQTKSITFCRSTSGGFKFSPGLLKTEFDPS